MWGELAPPLAERRSGPFVLGFAAVLGGVLLVNWPGRHAGREGW